MFVSWFVCSRFRRQFVEMLLRLPTLPIIAWLKAYSAAHFFADVSAGATVAVLLVPQSLAYGSSLWRRA